jgi:predicted ATPase/DNA-binding XRE family transcriptional regulator
VNTTVGSFAGLLRQFRAKAGLTQEELAERANLSTRAISDLERGIKHRPYPHTVRQLVLALELDEEQTVRFQLALLPTKGTEDKRQESSRRVMPSISLPIPPTPFIGRQKEIEELQALFSHGAFRLLTLAGPGGVGKTRLALQVAQNVAPLFPDGVSFVSLGPLTVPDGMPAAIASSLEIRELRGLPILEVLTAYLRSREMLLVLDNFEHLLPAADVVSRLLASCPLLVVLVTSRTVLRLSAEREYPVHPLALPIPGHLPTAEALSRYDSIQLFVQRAQAVNPAFRMTEDNASTVAGICCRLDGLPLAIELAASRTKLFPLPALLEWLSGSLKLLEGGARDVPSRQQTLWNTIQWSYDLLSSEEQALFARLSVFSGGCSLEAAASVCAPEDDLDLLERLTSLIDKSLVRQIGDEEPRFEMLEILREYAREQLAANGAQESARQRHAAYYLSLAERAEPQFLGSDQMRWLDRVEREHENLRAALRWCSERGEGTRGEKTAQAAETGLRLAASLHWFWLFRDHHREGLAWLEQSLARSVSAPANVRAKALCNAGILAGLVGEMATSRTFLTRSVQLSREIGDRYQLSCALAVLGSTPWSHDWDEPSAAVLEESLALAREVGHPWLVGHALLHSVFRVVNSVAITRGKERAAARTAGEEGLSRLAEAGDGVPAAVLQLSLGRIAQYEGDYPRARTAFTACLPVLRVLGWNTTLGDALVGLGDVARRQGDDREAAVLYAEAVALYRSVGDRLAPACTRTLGRLAETNFEQGDWAAAESGATESLALARDTSQVGSSEIMGALMLHAALASVRGMPARALRLASAADVIHAYSSPSPEAADRDSREQRLNYLPPSPHVSALAACGQLLEHHLTAARQALSADEQAAAWAEGQGMSAEQAITYALDGSPPPVNDVPSDLRPSREQRQGRALDHLQGQGWLSPRTYAALLGVSTDTALRDLNDLAQRGVVQATGRTRNRRYVLTGEAAGRAIHRTGR